MLKGLQPRYAVLGLAIAACLVSLALAVHRINGTERALGRHASENIVWNMAQNEVELGRFLDVLTAYGRGAPDVDRDRLLFRFDMLWSRLHVATEGEMANRLDGVADGRAVVARARQVLAQVEPAVLALAHGDTLGARAVQERLSPLRPDLHQAAVDSVHYETGAALAQDALRRRELTAALAFLGGALIGTGILVVLLVGEVRAGARLTRLARGAEAQVRASRALLRAVIDAVPALINVKDGEGRYVFMNRFQADVYGIDPETAVGATSSAFTGPDYGGESERLDQEVVRSGRGLPFVERPFVDVHGRRRLWWTSKQPLLGAEGGVEHIVTVAMDITELKTAERARRNLARHVSPNMVDTLAQRDDPIGKVRTQDVAVVFADIVGFTRFSAQHPPAAVMATLRELHASLTEIVLAHGGTLEKFLGDGIMATFGTPRAEGSEATRALAAVADMVAASAAWNAMREEAAQAPLRIGIGAHFGPVLLGEVGSARRVEYAVIGVTVNLASRLQDLTRTLGTAVVVSETLLTTAAAEGPEGRRRAAAYRGIGAHAVDGFDSPVPVAVLPAAGAASTVAIAAVSPA